MGQEVRGRSAVDGLRLSRHLIKRETFMIQDGPDSFGKSRVCFSFPLGSGGHASRCLFLREVPIADSRPAIFEFAHSGTSVVVPGDFSPKCLKGSLLANVSLVYKRELRSSG